MRLHPNAPRKLPTSICFVVRIFLFFDTFDALPGVEATGCSALGPSDICGCWSWMNHAVASYMLRFAQPPYARDTERASAIESFDVCSRILVKSYSCCIFRVLVVYEVTQID